MTIKFVFKDEIVEQDIEQDTLVQIKLLKGEQGYTPVKGVDYFTTADKEEIESEILEPINEDIEELQGAISDIETEQTTQNTSISQNASDIADLKTDKANKSETYSKTETDALLADKITKNVDDLVNYTKTGDMTSAINNAVDSETTARQNADTNLQGQIDAITSASDVVDVVGTYIDLQNYDTSKLTDKDLIKVMQDSTHNNALSYYRWVSNAWTYVGSEGPFYTKSENDTLLNGKQDKIDNNNKLIADLVDDTNSTNKFVTTSEKEAWNDKLDQSALANYVKNTDYATSKKAGIVRNGLGFDLSNADGYIRVNGYSLSDFDILPGHYPVSKSTLHNVIQGRLYTQDQINQSQAEQDTNIQKNTDNVTALLEKLNYIEGLIPDGQASGESIDLSDSARYPFQEFKVGGNSKQQSYTGKNLLNKNNVTLNAYFNSTNGEIVNDSTNTNCIFNDYIPCNSNSNIIVSVNKTTVSTLYAIVEYDSNKDFIKYTSSGNTESKSYTFTSQANTAYIRLRYKYGNDYNIGSVIDELNLMISTSSDTTYEPYVGGQASPNPSYPQPVENVSGEVEVKVQTGNLIDITKHTNTLASNTTIIDSNSYQCNSTETWQGRILLLLKDLKPNTDYTIFAVSSSSRTIFSVVGIKDGQSKTLIDNIYRDYLPKTFNTSDYKEIKIDLYARGNGGTNGLITVKDIHLVEGNYTSSTIPQFVKHEEQIATLHLPEGMEMCKIKTYQDTFVEQDGKWYKKKLIEKGTITSIFQFYNDGYGSIYAFFTKPSKSRDNGTYATNTLYSKGTISGLGNVNWYGIVYKVGAYTEEEVREKCVGTEYYYVLKEPVLEEITDETLISDLNNLKNLYSYKGTTHISSSNSPGPIFEVAYKKDIESLLS